VEYERPVPTSGTAIATLVTGILSVVPCLGLLAVPATAVCGILGWRSTRPDASPPRRGRGLVWGGLAGLIAGVAIHAAGIAWFTWAATAGAEPTRDLARSFVTDLAEGDRDAAAAVLAREVQPAELDPVIDLLRPYGGLADMQFQGFRVFHGTRGREVTVDGVARFADGASGTFTLQTVERDRLRVLNFNITGLPDPRATPRAAPATRPASGE